MEWQTYGLGDTYRMCSLLHVMYDLLCHLSYVVTRSENPYAQQYRQAEYYAPRGDPRQDERSGATCWKGYGNRYGDDMHNETAVLERWRRCTQELENILR